MEKRLLHPGGWVISRGRVGYSFIEVILAIGIFSLVGIGLLGGMVLTIGSLRNMKGVRELPAIVGDIDVFLLKNESTAGDFYYYDGSFSREKKNEVAGYLISFSEAQEMEGANLEIGILRELGGQRQLVYSYIASK